MQNLVESNKLLLACQTSLKDVHLDDDNDDANTTISTRVRLGLGLVSLVKVLYTSKIGNHGY
jgi:hypothetical protein